MYLEVYILELLVETCELSGINNRVGVKDLYKYLKDIKVISFSLLRNLSDGRCRDESGVPSVSLRNEHFLCVCVCGFSFAFALLIVDKTLLNIFLHDLQLTECFRLNGSLILCC